jgi:hypothetical protein
VHIRVNPWLKRLIGFAFADRHDLRSSPAGSNTSVLSILGCWLRFRRGSLSFARLFPRLCSSSVTKSTDFLLLFGSGHIALAPFFAFLTQLLLVQIGLELFIGKTTAQTSGGNCQCRCNFYWPATRHHMPWAFGQRIAVRKRKFTTTRSTFMRHSLSYRDRLKSSNADVAPRATSLSTAFLIDLGHIWSKSGMCGDSTDVRKN